MKCFLFLIAVFFSLNAHAQQVRIAVAANFLATVKAIKPLYEAETGNKLVISGSSSGKLYAQIIHGAPFDLFFSADKHYTQQLIDEGKAEAESRFVYATGRLVAWSPTKKISNEKDIDMKATKRIAMANPKTAPYGLAAVQVLQNLNLWQAAKKKIVKGESVGQAFQFVATGNSDFGFVALSQVLSPYNRKNRDIYWLVPQTLYSPLQQEVVLLTRAKHNNAAQGFLSFMKSPNILNLLNQHGYL